MRWLVSLAVLLWLLTPAATWAQTVPYDPAARSVGSAVSNTVSQSLDRRGVTPEVKATTLQKIRDYLALPAFSGQTWIKIGQALGLPVGTNLTKGYDPEFCAQNAADGSCSLGGGGGWGGGGTEASYGDSYCNGNEFTLDFAGNTILRAMDLPNPQGYSFGQKLWYGGSASPYYNTTSPLSSIKVALHQYNGLQDAAHQLAPMYVGAFTTITSSLYASAPAYYEGSTLKSAPAVTFTSNANSTAWATSTIYGVPPPSDFKCEAGIGLGDYNQHYKACIGAPSAWSIPTYGVIPAAQMAAWAKGSTMSSCKLNPEIIRQIADRAYKAACNNNAPECAPYQRVEPEDVRTGGKDPTVREAATTTDKNLPGTSTPATPTEPTTTPTTTPTTGPDWTDPHTAAPYADSPTGASIIDKAFDWGFPAIQINIGSATCPTYTADFFGHTLTLDSHCPFIEQNRAVISAMMILLFTFAAGIIVLRA